MNWNGIYVGLLTAAALAGRVEGGAAGAWTPRTDINPAVLYWQGFSLYPTLPTNLSQAMVADAPKLSPADAEAFMERLDATFKFVRRAARMQAPCDWGWDPADGPEAIVPNLVKVRQCANAGRVRAYLALHAGREQDAVEDLGALVVLGRNVAVEPTMVTAMIGVAVEDLVVNFVARNFDRFSPAALGDLQRRIDAAPRRSTVQDAILGEQRCFCDWFIARLEALGANPAGAGAAADKSRELAQAREKARALLNPSLGEDEVDQIIASAGETPAGLAAYFKQLHPLYASAQKVAEASPSAVQDAAAALARELEGHSNLVARVIFPNVGKARTRELELVVRQAMLRAAIILRVDGETAFRRVKDPFADGPFTLQPLAAESGETGFRLISAANGQGIKAELKFTGGEPASAPAKPSFE